MNYKDALFAMQTGQKVKLPEWIGYWWMPNVVAGDPEQCIRVLTKGGDILDTPWIDKYRSRDDWEITDGALGFEFAILALKNGKRVTCDALGGNWLQLITGMQPEAQKIKPVFWGQIIRCAPAHFNSDNKINCVVYQLWAMSSKWLLFTDYTLCNLHFADKIAYSAIDKRVF